jgi:hypothetical protein
MLFVSLVLVLGLLLFSIYKDKQLSEQSNINKNESIDKPQKCSDGTFFDRCSLNKPKFCLNNSLIDKASVCGCSPGWQIKGESCFSEYSSDPKKQILKYTINSKNHELQFQVYGGLNKYLSELPRYIKYSGEELKPTDKDLLLKMMDENIQKNFLNELIFYINNSVKEDDDKARIAISIVQNIPYDFESVNSGASYKYPYEVLYSNKGVCSEKSTLLAYFLRELGYGIAMFRFEAENHDAVGIKCPLEYSYINSGYCFIETTEPAIITDTNGNYISFGKLISNPRIIELSSGKSFDSVSTEYSDAIEFKKIQPDSPGQKASDEIYEKWLSLVNKYGLKIS